MIFGAACSPTIAQYVKNINAERFTDQFPKQQQRSKTGPTWMITSIEGRVQWRYGSWCMRSPTFHIHKWASNDPARTGRSNTGGSHGKSILYHSVGLTLANCD